MMEKPKDEPRSSSRTCSGYWPGGLHARCLFNASRLLGVSEEIVVVQADGFDFAGVIREMVAESVLYNEAEARQPATFAVTAAFILA